MELYELKNTINENSCINVKFPSNVDFDEILVVSSSFYSVFLDNKFIHFGPYRSPNEFLRINHIKKTGNTSNLKIEFINYGIETFDLENRHFIFAIELLKDNKVVLNLSNCSCHLDESYISQSNRYSFQRGFVERHDLSKNEFGSKVDIVRNSSAKLIGDAKDYCLYGTVSPKLETIKNFEGFSDFEGRPCFNERNNIYDPEKIIKSLNKSYYEYKFDFRKIYSGIISFEIESNKEETIYLVFDEFLPDNKWMFLRSTCNDFIEVKLKKGKNTFYSKVPYTLRHLLLLTKEKFTNPNIKIVKIQNDSIKTHRTGNKEIDNVIIAAERTFKQNAVDIFTDCPGRERAGWLCDSYFSGRAESFFTGNHNIEKCFLENYLYEVSPELPEGMIPMCYPSVHKDHTFIPGWALWFIVEVEAYYNETKDIDLIIKLKDKIYNILEYFEKFENEYFLLENLESWVFIEWSENSSEEFLKEISICNNMLYKGALDCVYKLYRDEKALEKANKIKKNINDIAFNGKYYLDNARRVDNKVVATANLISETNQYFAYFFKINNDESFFNTILTANKDKNLKESAVFIGKFLRMLCLDKNNEYAKIINEFVPYFSKMANETSTLWEKDQPLSSCNHCFASILAPILYNSYLGLKK